MYSVVLMAALTTGGSAPDGWCHHGGGWGHHNGYGGVSSTCTGCYGGSYYGTWSCACYGGCGGGIGCYGGGWGGYGGGWGGMAYGGLNYNCFGCHGCYGCAGVYGCGGYSPYGQPSTPEQIPAPKVEEKKPGGSSSVTPDRARVIVQLPAGAKLFVDDNPIATRSDNEAFNTPRLERGQTYYYEVRAEAVRDGKTVVESKRVLVKAGQEVTVAFPKLGQDASVATADAKRDR